MRATWGNHTSVAEVRAGRSTAELDPAIIGAQFLPSAGRNLAGQRSWASAACAFGDDLPALVQRFVHVGVAPKPGIRAQDGAGLLSWREGEILREDVEHRDIGGAAMLVAGVQA